MIGTLGIFECNALLKHIIFSTLHCATMSLFHLGLMQVMNIKFFSKEHEGNMPKIVEQVFFPLNIA
jgi:hypothetical protein